MATWKEDVVKALENLGGKAHRLEIIKEVERLRPDNLNKDVVYIKYLPPSIDAIEFPQSNGDYTAPTTGCAEYAENLNEGSRKGH